jgi:phage gpG-like protein
MAKKINELSGDLMRISQFVKSSVPDILPRIVAVEGKNHFEESWQNQGFTDKNLVKWQKRQFNQKKLRKDRQRTAAYRRFQDKDRGRAILVSHQTDTKGTHLKDSIRVESDKKKVEFSTDKAYAEVHNEGGRSGRGKGFIMPQRQFMGPSEVLDKKIEAKLNSQMDKFFDNLKL